MSGDIFYAYHAAPSAPLPTIAADMLARTTHERRGAPVTLAVYTRAARPEESVQMGKSEQTIPSVDGGQ